MKKSAQQFNTAQLGPNPLDRVKAQMRNLGDIAYEALWEAILSGHLKPAQRLSEREISQRLGTSATPVKEALQRLAYEGFVKVSPRRGTYVADSVFTPLHEICQIRAALEGVGAKLAAEKATNEQIRSFKEQLETMHRFTTNYYDVDQLYAANTKFHELVYAASHNPYITQLLTSLRSFTMAIRRYALSDVAEARRGLREHRAIFEAIASHDSRTARDRMEAHILRTMENVAPASKGPDSERRLSLIMKSNRHPKDRSQ